MPTTRPFDPEPDEPEKRAIPPASAGVPPEAFTREILDNIGCPVYVKDLHGRYLSVNRHFEELFGRPEAEFVGRTVAETFPAAIVEAATGAAEAAAAETAERLHRNDLLVAERGEILRFHETLPFPEGPRTYLSVKFPIRGPAGAAGPVVAVGGVSLDMTERLRAEQALAALHQRTGPILNAIEEGVCTLDGAGRLLFFNPAAERILSRRLTDLAGVDAHATLHHTRPDGRPHRADDCPIQQVLADGVSRSAEEDVFWKPDGTAVPVSYRASALREDGESEGAAVTGVVVVFRDLTERRRQSRTERHMAAAVEVQQRLLPVEAPTLAGFDVAGAAYPAERACGDSFDFIPLPDGSWCLAVGDVSGHGLGPALHMVETRAALRTLLDSPLPFDQVLARLNRLLYADLAEGAFVTLFLACLDPSTRRLTYAGAGHEARLIRADGEVLRLSSTAPLLGLIRDFRHEPPAPLTLSSGDVLVIPTDGLTETACPDRGLFGWQGVIDAVAAYRGASAAELVERLCLTARSFARDRPPSDDVTLVVAKAD